MKDETAKSEIRIINKKAFPWAFTDFRRGHCKHGTCPTSDPMYPSALAPSRNLEPGHAGADPYPHPTHTGLYRTAGGHGQHRRLLRVLLPAQCIASSRV